MANLNMREFFSAIAVQAGIDTESTTFKSLIENEAFEKVTVPDEISTGIQNNLLNLSSAKNHPEVAKHFKGKYYDTTDRAFKKNLKASGMPDELINELDSEQDTIKKLEIGLSKYGEFVKSAFAKDGNSDKYQELVKKHNELQSQYNQAVEGFKTKENKWFSDLETKEVQWELNNMLNGYTYTDAIPADDVKLIANNKLNQLPYVFKKVEGKIGVFQKEHPDLVASKNNKPLTPKDVIEEVVSPYVKKSQSTTTQKTESTTQQRTVVATENANASTYAERNAGRNAEILAKLKEDKKI